MLGSFCERYKMERVGVFCNLLFAFSLNDTLHGEKGSRGVGALQGYSEVGMESMIVNF